MLNNYFLMLTDFHCGCHFIVAKLFCDKMHLKYNYIILCFLASPQTSLLSWCVLKVSCYEVEVLFKQIKIVVSLDLKTEGRSFKRSLT